MFIFPVKVHLEKVVLLDQLVPQGQMDNLGNKEQQENQERMLRY